MRNYNSGNLIRYTKSRMSIKGCSNLKLVLKEYIIFDVRELVVESYQNMEYVGETIERKVKEKLKLYGFNIKLCGFYAYLMREVMRNVVEHSQAPNFILLIYSNEENEFGFKIIDNGIGIKDSLNTNPEYSVANDETAVAFSIRPGITRSFKKDPLRNDEWQNSGFGLYMVSRITSYMSGRFELTSGNSTINFLKNRVSYAKKNIKGTEVTVVINTKQVIDPIKIINKVSKEGSEYLKDASKPFAYYATVDTASKASTLLNE